MKNLVIVESPAKAKTIGKYLGADYSVVASYGHIRDLPSKNGAINPQTLEFTWEVDDKSLKHVKEILKLAKKTDTILLATDPDREGEAISWHIRQELQQNKIEKPCYRVVFHEITKNAVITAVNNPKNIDQNLVNAYLTRRGFDYFMGFLVSPVLWRRLPGSKSAGRVQSVALRIISERELEIEQFVSKEYWHIEAKFGKLIAKLHFFNGNKLDKFSIENKEQAQNILDQINQYTEFIITNITDKKINRSPCEPFSTSSLQQDAYNKLGFSVSKTMQIAQKLYEGMEINGETQGLITYMRTDSTNLSKEAIQQIRELIKNSFSPEFLPKEPKIYLTKDKNAQEAHEAIRPTNLNYTPEFLENILDRDALKLYTLIWRRSIACQMSNAIFNNRQIQIAAYSNQAALDYEYVGFKSNITTCDFLGYLAMYKTEEEEENITMSGEYKALSILKPNKIESFQHFTEPPSRYTEGSLVKTLKELGIGRPSTYASIINVLQDRGYATLNGKSFSPSDRGRIVTAFLQSYFNKYLEYDFTAQLEEFLDEIANGKKEWGTLLQDFFNNLTDAVKLTTSLTITQVIDMLNQTLGKYFFGENCKCSACKEGDLSIKISKFGIFIGCSRYPDCKFTRNLSLPSGDLPVSDSQDRVLGHENNKEIVLKKGPYGFYVEYDGKRITVPKNFEISNLDINIAKKLIELPKVLGADPLNGQPVKASIGMYGPYVGVGKNFVSVKSLEQLFNMDLETALNMINNKVTKKSKA